MALGTTPSEKVELNTEEWFGLHKLATKQALLGIVFYAVERLGLQKSGQIPKELYLRWYYQAEGFKALNQQHYDLSKQMTELFTAQGRRTLILKGQANSRLYPDKFIRQTGDIDLWIEGGRESVIKLLSQMDLMKASRLSSHDVTLSKDAFGVDVEVHFDYMQDVRNPFAVKHLRNYLSQQMDSAVRVPEGFDVPSNKFALVMQLAHIRKHVIGLGVGFRQLTDYFILLKTASDEERAEVSSLLDSFGLRRFAGALMWLLSEKLGLESRYLLCEPDARRGQVLLQEILADGNFGKRSRRKKGGVFLWWLRNRLRAFRLLWFDFGEMSWYLLRYWGMFLVFVPRRIAAYCRFITKH